MSDLIMTDEQRETLQKHEKHLHTAYYADYVVGLNHNVVRLLFSIYNDIYSAHETNYTCNYCVLHVCKGLGRLYFKNTKQ